LIKIYRENKLTGNMPTSPNLLRGDLQASTRVVAYHDVVVTLATFVVDLGHTVAATKRTARTEEYNSSVRNKMQILAMHETITLLLIRIRLCGEKGNEPDA
jgi:hypothetical protein